MDMPAERIPFSLSDLRRLIGEELFFQSCGTWHQEVFQRGRKEAGSLSEIGEIGPRVLEGHLILPFVEEAVFTEGSEPEKVETWESRPYLFHLEKVALYPRRELQVVLRGRLVSYHRITGMRMGRPTDAELRLREQPHHKIAHSYDSREYND